jgi:glycosyltransferase involved in cell wall biosynthesis
MRILVLGKVPPIEGGTSTQTLTTVRALLERGHEVHVVTNAGEVEPGCRQLLTGSDRATLAAFGAPVAGGRLTVHHTTPLDDTAYIPWAQPFGSKLFGLGIGLAGEQTFDLIVARYLEPYGLVAAQLAEITATPLVLAHAGSDVGRLAYHPDLGPAYRWALGRADVVLTGPGHRDTLIAMGARPERLVFSRAGARPDYFSSPEAPLDLDELGPPATDHLSSMGLPGPLTTMLVDNLADHVEILARPTFGVYGKVAPSKGSYDLIEALETLAGQGADFALLGAVGGHRRLLEPFLEAVAGTRHLRRRTVLLPFVAPWRVPHLIDACDVVCFLERDFDVAVHRTRVPLEVLTRGRALVLSGEIADGLRFGRRLIDGANYLRVEDPTDRAGLARRLDQVLGDPLGRRAIAHAGRSLAETIPGVGDPDGPADAIDQVLTDLTG